MVRTGLGFDSHRFETGKPLRLGGVSVPHEAGLSAHSDGDVVLHALTDALLGALAEGDIGEHFPDTDPANAGADSRRFLTFAVDLAHRRGWRPTNVDITVIAERPKLSDYKQPIAEQIADLLSVDRDCVSIKAKTAEGMGLLGNAEGIAAWATILLQTQT